MIFDVDMDGQIDLFQHTRRLQNKNWHLCRLYFPKYVYLVGTKLGNGFMNRLSDIINIVWGETAHANAAILQ